MCNEINCIRVYNASRFISEKWMEYSRFYHSRYWVMYKYLVFLLQWLKFIYFIEWFPLHYPIWWKRDLMSKLFEHFEYWDLCGWCQECQVSYFTSYMSWQWLLISKIVFKIVKFDFLHLSLQAYKSYLIQFSVPWCLYYTSPFWYCS